MNTKAVMSITDEQIAEIEGEAIEAVQINRPTSISGARILALISRLRVAEAKLNTICVELPEACGMTTAELDEGYNAGHLKWEILNALTAAGVAYK